MGRQLTWLDGAGPFDVARFGGKAVGLHQLCEAGVAVPEGFVVPAGISMASARSEVLWAIQQMRHRWGRGIRFAVRSSAVAEDGLHDSFAGMFTTVLGVEGHQVLEAIETCRASASAPRVYAYAGSRSIEAGQVAVIVQRLVESDVSGVCFTMNPLTRDTSEIVIEAVRGGGEKLVGGEVTPQCYRLSLADGSIIEFSAGDQDSVVDPILSATALTGMWKEFVSLARRFDYPLDLEFACVGEVLYLLQARPVTTAAGSAA